MSDVLLVSLGPANDPETLSPALQHKLQSCARIVYPGDWIHASMQQTFGPRLVIGRKLTTEDVLRLVRKAKVQGERVAVLYNGDGALFSGRPEGGFASMAHLEHLLQEEGLVTERFGGLSSAQLALHQAGWYLPATPQARFLAAAPFCQGFDAQALEQALRLPCVLALVWCEDFAARAYPLLENLRGAKTTAAIVRNLGSAEQSVLQGPLASLRTALEELEPPAVILIAQRCAVPWRDEAGHLRFEIGPANPPIFTRCA